MRAVKDMCVGFHSSAYSMHIGEQAFQGSYRSVIVKPKDRCLTAQQLLDSLERAYDALWKTALNMEKTLRPCVQ